MNDKNHPNDHRFLALRTHATPDGAESRLERLTAADLNAGDLLVRTRHAGVNYKDSLAVTGRAKVLQGASRVAGIELVGDVVDAARGDHGFCIGDTVLVHGFETGIAFDGGFSEIVRVPAGHAMRLPDGLAAREAAVIGVPGFTVAIALERFEAMGLGPTSGVVAVSGATGAVGMLAILVLKGAGYRVAALTRRAEWTDRLVALGADEVVVTADLSADRKPLLGQRFAAAIDNVGGETLSWLLRGLQQQGMLASVGNAAGIEFSCNVLPFILRQVQLFGVAANAPWPVRRRLWRRLATDWKPALDRLAPHVHELRLEELLAHCRQQVDGRSDGRTLVAFEAA